jgi:hypothetical protein
LGDSIAITLTREEATRFSVARELGTVKCAYE